jgi:hypothetical protein
MNAWERVIGVTRLEVACAAAFETMNKVDQAGLFDAVCGKAFDSAVLDKIGHAQNSQLLRHDRLRDTEQLLERAYSRFIFDEERDNPQSHRMCKSLQKVRNNGRTRCVMLEISHKKAFFRADIDYSKIKISRYAIIIICL